MRHWTAAALLLIPAALSAQATHTVSPGMTRAQVVSALGTPATARTASDFTYLFYLNSCGKRCGMNDLVILRGDSVVDAIFRAPDRHYTGTSSSPAPLSRAAAEKQKPAAAGQPVRIAPSKQANDARPSIPRTPPTTAPAGQPSPQPKKKSP